MDLGDEDLSPFGFIGQDDREFAQAVRVALDDLVMGGRLQIDPLFEELPGRGPGEAGQGQGRR